MEAVVNLSVIRDTSRNPDFIMLALLLDADLARRYGALQSTYERYNRIETLNSVVVAYLDRQPAACGAYRHCNDTTVEIKRMFVREDQRRKGLAIGILNELENWAQETGYTRVILETGRRQEEAIRLYRKSGYLQMENYGQYRGNDNSVCFQKAL
jgi:GNAT superfamily N-acetyltransferase